MVRQLFYEVWIKRGLTMCVYSTLEGYYWLFLGDSYSYFI